jgi:hypothetical protein
MHMIHSIPHKVNYISIFLLQPILPKNLDSEIAHQLPTQHSQNFQLNQIKGLPKY